MSAHTPGPWESRFSPDHKEIRIVSRDGVIVVELPMRDLPLGAPEANARLIAAAPELLSSLEELVGVIDALGVQGGPKMERARAALKKAKEE